MVEAYRERQLFGGQAADEQLTLLDRIGDWLALAILWDCELEDWVSRQLRRFGRSQSAQQMQSLAASAPELTMVTYTGTNDQPDDLQTRPQLAYRAGVGAVAAVAGWQLLRRVRAKAA